MKSIFELTSVKEAASRPEFYNFMNVGMKDLLFGAYHATPSTYEEVVTQETSTKDKEGYPSIGSSGLPEKVLEGEPFSEKPIGSDDYVELTNAKFGKIIAITREMIDDDQTRQMRNQPLELGGDHKKKEDKTVYSIINGNPTIYDAVSFFHVDHPGVTGGAAITQNNNLYTNVTMTAGALATAIGYISGWCGHTSDDILDIAARKVLVPANLLAAAEILTAGDLIGWAYAANNLGPASTNGQVKNPFKKYGLSVVSSPRLDRTSTGDWYIVTDFPGLIFQWRSPLQLMAENENSGVRFERDVYRWRSDARWAVGVINWRCMMKVS